MVLSDFISWHGSKIGEFLVSGGKTSSKWIRPSRNYSANASTVRRSRFFGSELLMELNRRRVILYAREVIHMAFGDIVRNSNAMDEEGVRWARRVARKCIRGEALADYALMQRGGSPSWGFPNSCDVQSGAGFWRAKFAPRFNSEFENGMISNASGAGMSFSRSTSGRPYIIDCFRVGSGRCGVSHSSFVELGGGG